MPPSDAGPVSRETQRTALDDTVNGPLTLRVRLHLELRLESGFLRQIFRLLLSLCDLWQYRNGTGSGTEALTGNGTVSGTEALNGNGNGTVLGTEALTGNGNETETESELNREDKHGPSSSTSTTTTTATLHPSDIRVILREKTGTLIATIARAGYNDELLCAILNLGSDFTSSSYSQLEKIDVHSSQLLINALKPLPRVGLLAHYEQPIPDRLPYEMLSCLVCVPLSYQKQIVHISELLTALQNVKDKSMTTKFIQTIVSTTTFYTDSGALNKSVTSSSSSSSCSSSSSSSSSSVMGCLRVARKGMMYLPPGTVYSTAMSQLGQALISSPSESDQVTPASIGAEAIEPLLLLRLDQSPEEDYNEALYSLAKKLEVAAPATYYIRALMDAHNGNPSSLKLDTLLPILATSQVRAGHLVSSSIAFKILIGASNKTLLDPKLVLRLLYLHPQRDQRSLDPRRTYCPFDVTQSSQLLECILADSPGCLRAFKEYNRSQPFFSVELLVKEQSLVELLTTSQVKCSIVPADSNSFLQLWTDLFLTQDATFLTLFQALGDTVVMKMMNERVTPKLKTLFNGFMIVYYNSHSKTGSGPARWSIFKASAMRKLKSKKPVQQIVSSFG